MLLGNATNICTRKSSLHCQSDVCNFQLQTIIFYNLPNLLYFRLSRERLQPGSVIAEIFIELISNASSANAVSTNVISSLPLANEVAGR